MQMTDSEIVNARYWLAIIAERDGFNVEMTVALVDDGEDDYDAREWADSCAAMNAAEARWVDNGCSNHYDE